MKKTLSLTLLLLSLSCFAKVPSIEDYAYSKQWLRIVHYSKSIWGYKSQADRKEYFISSEGKKSPLAELKATIAAFQSDIIPKHLRWHPICAYPSRKIVIERDLGIKFPKRDCSDYEWWKSRIKAKGISLVFSSYFAGNPASMFGHTLIKFNTSATGPGKLRDFSLNFAANTQGDGGLLYIVKGALGGFPGFFSTDPYYVRVNEYSQGESRDLWEYQIDFNQEEVDLFVAHAWELKMNTFFDYYFFDENCSYMLLKMLEVVRLDWQLSHGFTFYAMPIDTVRRVEAVNGIKSVNYRPSFRKKMEEKIAVLSDEDKSLLKDIVAKEKDFQTAESKEVIEAYSSYLQYKRFEDGGTKEQIKEMKALVGKVLVKRARLGGKTTFDENKVVEKYRKFDPLKSHDAYTIELQNSYRKDIKGMTDFKFRWALADLYNNDFGYPDFFELQGPNFTFRYLHEEEKFLLQELEITSLLSLTPYTWTAKDTAWGINAKLERPDDYDSGNSINAIVEGFYGLSLVNFNRSLNTYALASLKGEVGKSLRGKGYRLLPGLRLGMIYTPVSWMKMLVDMRARYSIQDIFTERFLLEGSAGFAFYFSRNFELHIKERGFTLSQRDELEWQHDMSLVYFF